MCVHISVCDHIQDLDGADIKNFCEKPKPVKCPQVILIVRGVFNNYKMYVLFL